MSDQPSVLRDQNQRLVTVSGGSPLTPNPANAPEKVDLLGTWLGPKCSYFFFQHGTEGRLYEMSELYYCLRSDDSA